MQKVVLIKNQDFIEITLKPEALSNTKYKIELEQNRSILDSGTGPHYKVEIVSIEKFVRDFEELMEDVPEDQRFDYKIEDRGDYTSIFFNWGFLILLIFGFWFLMRRMTGGGGPGGQIFNIGNLEHLFLMQKTK